MNREDFTENAPGKLVKIDGPAFAFVPGHLPPRSLLVSETIHRATTRAFLRIGELNGRAASLPNPHLLIAPLKTREAIHSSRIEGTFTTPEQLTIFEATPRASLEDSSEMEVRNYVDALELGLRQLPTLPVSCRLICEIHKVLMTNVRGHNKAPGEFRRIQNFIGTLGGNIASARYVPPPPQEIPALMSHLEHFIHDDKSLDELIKSALIHYYFEAVHPFIDGNGRVGRLLIPLIMCDWKVLNQPTLYLSSYFEKHQRQYRDYLQEVSTQGNWEEWILFFLEGVESQASDAIDRCNLLLALQQDFRRRLEKGRSPVNALKLADLLFENPWTTMAEAAKQLQVTQAAAQRTIDKLVAVEILVEYTQRRRNRIYLAREILEIVKRD